VRLSTSPESKFVQTLVVQRPLRDRIVTLRARTLTERGPAHDTTVVLASEAELADLLRAVFGIDPAALGPQRMAHLWRRAAEQHAAHRPAPAA
jgi:N-hydroxyarylamine O-acetyltransferase